VSVRPASDCVPLLGGWRWLEDSGIWSANELSEFVFRVPLENAGAVELAFHAFHERRVETTVLLNGHEFVTVVGHGEPQVIAIPLPAAEAGQVVRLGFRTDRMYCPDVEFASGDVRRLGIFFESLTIRSELSYQESLEGANSGTTKRSRLGQVFRRR